MRRGNFNRSTIIFQPPSKSVWHIAAVWNPRCTQTWQRQEQAWQTVMQLTRQDKHSTICWQSVSCPVPASLLVFLPLSLFFCPHGIPSRQQQTRRARCAIYGFCFSIRSFWLAAFLGKKYSNDKDRFQHESVWRGGGSFLAKKASINTFKRLAHALQFIHGFCFSSPHQFSSSSCTQTHSTAHVRTNFQITGQSSND